MDVVGPAWPILFSVPSQASLLPPFAARKAVFAPDFPTETKRASVVMPTTRAAVTGGESFFGAARHAECSKGNWWDRRGADVREEKYSASTDALSRW